MTKEIMLLRLKQSLGMKGERSAQWQYMREAPEILMTTKGLRIGNNQITILSLMLRSFLAHNASSKNVGGNKVADHLLKLFLSCA